MKFLNTLNRIIIVILCLVLILTFTSILIIPQVILTGVGDWMAEWGTYLGQQRPWVRLVVGALLAVVVDFVLALIIFLEVRPARKRYINVQQVAGGMANVSIESVNQLLTHKLDPLPGVIQVDPRIRAKGNKVEAVVDAEVTRDTNVPDMANRMIKIIQSALAEELGLQIAGQPQVRVNVTDQEHGDVKKSGAAETDEAASSQRGAGRKAGGGPPPLPPASSDAESAKRNAAESSES
jgi:hypothetical protein